MAPTTPATPPGLQEATHNSTVHWQDDLQALFHHAKDRFADVVWELQTDSGGVEEVWGHKAVVYARAPPSFQARYFSFKPPPIASPVPYSSSPTGTLPAQSALSLSLGLDFASHSRSPSPAPYRSNSPTPSTNTGALLRLPTNINPTLFANELEYLYTGKGLGEAFEFLFDSGDSNEDGNTDEGRLDKLRKDFVFMWRSRLYSDVRIALTGNFSSSNHESTTAVFSSHRFILVSRVPYFNTQLLQWAVKPSSPGEPLTLNLPSPPFTPASLHFTLGFIYTGTLVFSHRTFDLDTAFHIMRSATYLSLESLYDEIQARIVQEMMHGLFHAFLEFSEYEAITGGKWGTGGCRCRQCARRAPRVLEFSLLDDVKNPHLERGARRALVGLFGEGWCTSEFAALPQKTRDALLKGLAKRTTPMNVFPLLQATHAALKKLDNVIDAWGETVREMILAARKTIDDVAASQATECFEQPEWLEIMEADGVRFEDGERVEMFLEAMRRGLNEKNAAMAYQALVDSVLLRPHPTDPDAAMLSATSHVRVQVEQARMDIIRYIRRRWVTIRQEDGFAGLAPWAAQEIASELELKDESELFMPVTPSATSRGGRLIVRNGPVSKAEESDTVSVHSSMSAVPSRRAADAPKSSSASVRSVARSTHSTATRVTTTTISRRPPLSPGSLRPDSKLTPAHSTPTPSMRGSVADRERAKSPLSPSPGSTARNTSMSTASVRKSTTPSLHSNADRDRVPRPKSVAASVKSVAASVKSTRSTTSTIRKGVAGPSTLRPPSATSRPSSTLSTSSMSENSTAFETARSELTPSSVGRSRRGSAASSHSTVSVRTTGTSTPRTPRRPPSVASKTTSSVSRRPPPSPSPSAAEPPKPVPVAKRTVSTASVRSTISTKSTATRKSVARTPSGTPPTTSKPSTPAKKAEKPLPPEQDENNSTAAAGGTIKAKPKSPPSTSSHEKHGSVVSTASTSTLKRKSSADTIREAAFGEQPAQKLPRGATLEIGIPCIISSKKARFRAYARYIGEVEGEVGPWVGVEVPLNDAWPGDKLDGRDWHDGTWGGIRYFDIGSASEWEFGQDTTARRRRNEWLSTLGKDPKGSLKREGDQLSIERAKRLRSVSPAVSDMSTSESRGLFVRPQQVLYVIDAVGTDL